MEKPRDREQKGLVSQLIQGKELAEQLRSQFNNKSSHEMRQLLVEQILSTYEKALSMLNFVSAFETKPVINTSESPNSSEHNNPWNDCKDQGHRDVHKRRKTRPEWIGQVKICSESAAEWPLDDGYSWRKYGQKDILGSTFPRGYYRCTHRNSQGCLATKRVQRSDQDPTVFEVTYRGRHTCLKSPRLTRASSPSPREDKSKENNDSCDEKPKLLKELSFNFRDGLKSEDFSIFPSYFPDESYIGNENKEYDIFNDSMVENSLLGSLSSSVFISPATSESNYFSKSPCQYNSRTPESDSIPTSAADSESGFWDMFIENVDFDTSFPSENPQLFA